MLLAERSDLIAELDELRGLERGVLRIGLPPVGSGVLFAAMFAAYRSRYPKIDIELSSTAARSCMNACRPAKSTWRRCWCRLMRSLITRTSGLSRSLYSCRKVTRWREGKRWIFVHLAPSPFILFEAGFALNSIILSGCERKGVVPKVTAHSAQIDFIVDLVAARLGVAFLPKMLAQKHRHEGIVQIPLG